MKPQSVPAPVVSAQMAAKDAEVNLSNVQAGVHLADARRSYRAAQIVLFGLFGLAAAEVVVKPSKPGKYLTGAQSTLYDAATAGKATTSILKSPSEMVQPSQPMLLAGALGLALLKLNGASRAIRRATDTK